MLWAAALERGALRGKADQDERPTTAKTSPQVGVLTTSRGGLGASGPKRNREGTCPLMRTITSTLSSTKWVSAVDDLEATCWAERRMPGPGGVGWVEPVMEIIEIGAVMAALPGLELLAEFDSFVRPKLNPTLTDFCRTLTSIRQEDVDGAPTFPQALAAFAAWTGDPVHVLFASWGEYDKNQLLRDCRLYDVAFPFDGEHLNIKNHAAGKMGWAPKGVGKTIARLNMSFEGTPHRGLDDARNILRILRRVGL